MIRTLPKELEKFFDSKNITATDPVEFVIACARACVGINEVGGNNRGRMVELFQAVVRTPVGSPWCVDFIQAIVAYVELKLGIKSPVPSTDACLVLLKYGQIKKTGDIGDIIVWEMPNGGRHCGLIVGQNATRWTTIEGNTSSAGFNRDGDGVFIKNRIRGGHDTFKEAGFLRTF